MSAASLQPHCLQIQAAWLVNNIKLPQHSGLSPVCTLVGLAVALAVPSDPDVTAAMQLLILF
jgi:hypothetical protein